MDDCNIESREKEELLESNIEYFVFPDTSPEADDDGETYFLVSRPGCTVDALPAVCEELERGATFIIKRKDTAEPGVYINGRWEYES